MAALRNLFTVLLMLVPTVALACPACLGSQNKFTSSLGALGAMILFPFGVVYLVLRAIRNANRDLP
jgi:hypothetical protein